MTEYIDAEGVSYDSYQGYVECLVGLCGCRSDEIANDIFTVLITYLNRRINNKYTYYTDLPVEGPDKYRELILHMLDEADLIEHGTAIRGSWLTEKGKEVASRLQDELREGHAS